MIDMIWLVGNKGMLGTEIEDLFAEKGLNLLLSDREVDITDYNVVDQFLSGKDIKWIINCAAYTAVDRAEDEPEIAHLLNAKGAENLAKIAKLKGAKLIHISTDYVFDGEVSEPRTEEDDVNPVSVYGKTKLQGEEFIKEILDSHFIIRTAWLYGAYGNNFVYTMLKLMNSRDNINVVNDQHGSPTYTGDLAKVIYKIIRENFDGYGIYHFSNEGSTTWYDFAREIYNYGKESNLISGQCEVNPVGSDQFKTRAKRPSYSLLSKDKIRGNLGAIISDWKESLSEFFTKIKDSSEFNKFWN